MQFFWSITFLLISYNGVQKVFLPFKTEPSMLYLLVYVITTDEGLTLK